MSNALLVLLSCLYWFNPLLLIAAARFRRDQELACDEAVIIRYPQSRRAYGEAMLKTQLSPIPAPLACHWFGSHPLKERIAMLKNPTPTARRWRVGLVVALSVTALSTLAAWAAQPPKLVAQAAQEGKQEGAVLTTAHQKVSLRAAALMAAEQAKLKIVNPEVLPENPVSFEFDRVPVDTAFSLIAEEAGLDARISNGEVRFVPKAESGKLAPRNVTGSGTEGTMIDLRMKLQIDGEESAPRIITRSGEGFLIRKEAQPGGDKTDVTTIDGVATLLPDGKIEIATQIRRGTKLLGSPTIHLADGQMGSVEIRDDDSGLLTYKLEVDASAKPERYRDKLPATTG